MFHAFFNLFVVVILIGVIICHSADATELAVALNPSFTGTPILCKPTFLSAFQTLVTKWAVNETITRVPGLSDFSLPDGILLTYANATFGNSTIYVTSTTGSAAITCGSAVCVGGSSKAVCRLCGRRGLRVRGKASRAKTRTNKARKKARTKTVTLSSTPPPTSLGTTTINTLSAPPAITLTAPPATTLTAPPVTSVSDNPPATAPVTSSSAPPVTSASNNPPATYSPVTSSSAPPVTSASNDPPSDFSNTSNPIVNNTTEYIDWYEASYTLNAYVGKDIYNYLTAHPTAGDGCLGNVTVLVVNFIFF